MAVTYHFTKGRLVGQFSAEELKQESELFTRWALKQQNLPNAPVRAFKDAFGVAIARAEGRAVGTAEEESAAIALLQKGFFYSEQKQAHDHRNKHHGKGGWSK